MEVLASENATLRAELESLRDSAPPADANEAAALEANQLREKLAVAEREAAEMKAKLAALSGGEVPIKGFSQRHNLNPKT